MYNSGTVCILSGVFREMPVALLIRVLIHNNMYYIIHQNTHYNKVIF